MLKLVKPSKKYLKSFLNIIDDYKNDTSQFRYVEIGSMIKAVEENRVDEYLQNLDDYSRGINLPEGWVPGTTFWLMDGNNWVGSFTIRHKLTEKLEQWGGHIAANVSPKYRGKYSSFIGIKMCLYEAHKLGIPRVLMTCDASNNTSYRAITGLMKLYGGEQIPDSFVNGHNEHRVWINTKQK